MNRNPRTCVAHLEALLSLVEKEKDLHKYSWNRLKEGSIAHTRWENAAQVLNNHDNLEKRYKKSGRGWRETWRNQVKFTKFAIRRKESVSSLPVYKQRVLAIIEAVEGGEFDEKTGTTQAPMDGPKIKVECVPDQKPVIDLLIKKEPTDDWECPTPIEPEIIIKEKETPGPVQKIPNVPTSSFLGIEHLVVTIQSMDLINLIPVKSNAGDILYNCGTCTSPNIFKTSEQLIIHHLRDHSDKYQVRCDKCNIALANDSVTILKHAKYHFDDQPNVGPNPKDAHGLKQYACGVCALNFTRKDYLKEHMTQHWLEAEKSKPKKAKLTRNKNEIPVPFFSGGESAGTGVVKEPPPVPLVSEADRAGIGIGKEPPPVPMLQEQSHKCQHCPKIFDWSFQLAAHLKTHESKRFKCNICEKSYTSKQQLIFHLDVHSANKYPCKVCGEEFTIRRKLLRHIEIVHADTIQRRGKHISAENPNESDLMQAEKSKKRRIEGPFLCQTCGKSYPIYSQYNVHVQTHLEMEYQCDHCPKILRTKIALKMHMRHHIESKNHLCTKCGEAFQLPEHLAKHLRRVHKLCEEFECTVCSIKFDKSILLIEHLKEHPDNPRPFQCMDCSKAFVHADGLRKHCKEKHTTYKEKPFKCTLCPCSFVNRNRLKVHTMSHTKPFKCSLCPKAFSVEYTYKLHLDWHSGKRYKCDECGKEFTQARVLAGHMNTHTGAKPYHCLICDQRFPHCGNYYYHLATVHQ